MPNKARSKSTTLARNGAKTQSVPLAEHLVAAMLEPAVACAAAFGVGLPRAFALLEESYLRYLRDNNDTVQACADRMQISIRQAFKVKRRVAANPTMTALGLRDFDRKVLEELALGERTATGLVRSFAARTRRLATMRGARTTRGARTKRGARTTRGADQGLRVDMQQAVERLLAQGLIQTAANGKLALRGRMARHFQVGELALLAGLRDAMSTLPHLVQGRFARADALSRARVYALPALKTSLDRNADRLLGALIRELESIDKEAEDHAHGVDVHGPKPTASVSDIVRLRVSVFLAEELPAASTRPNSS